MQRLKDLELNTYLMTKKERKRVLKPVSLLLLERHASYLKTAILPIPIQEGEGEEGEGGCGGGEGRGEGRD